MELAADEPRVIGQLDHLAQSVLHGSAAYPEPGVLQPRQIVVVDLVTVTVALDDALLPVDAAHGGIGRQRAFLAAQAHGAAKVRAGVAPLDAAVAVLPFRDQRDHRVRGVGVEFRAVRAGEAGDGARVLDHRELHAQADTEVRDAVLPGVSDGPDLALHTALAEATRHQDRVHRPESTGAVVLDALRIHVMNLHPRTGMDTGMDQRLG